MHVQVEQEEEYIANRLLKRLEALKREKQVTAPSEAHHKNSEAAHAAEDIQSNCIHVSQASALHHKLFSCLCCRGHTKDIHLVRARCTPLQVLATEVEQEEEYLVNNLQKRMSKLHLEKAELERTLDQQRRKVRAAPRI